MKLRLLLTADCNRTCRGCCNKDWDLTALPICEDYSVYDEFLLTGGEPLLFPEKIKQVVKDIRAQSSAPIYVYTAKTDDAEALVEILGIVDGLTVTLHSRKDVDPFNKFNELVNTEGKALRINMFSTVSPGKVNSEGWKVKSGMRWLKNCPLPQDEVFMRAK
jgi:pyruvate-formate lyase-activating enzyme